MHVRHKPEEVEADKHRARGGDGRTDAKEGSQSVLEGVGTLEFVHLRAFVMPTSRFSHTRAYAAGRLRGDHV